MASGPGSKTDGVDLGPSGSDTGPTSSSSGQEAPFEIIGYDVVKQVPKRLKTIDERRIDSSKKKEMLDGMKLINALGLQPACAKE